MSACRSARHRNNFRKSRVSYVSARILARMSVSMSASWNAGLNKRLCRLAVDNTRRRATVDDDRCLFVAVGVQFCIYNAIGVTIKPRSSRGFVCTYWNLSLKCSKSINKKQLQQQQQNKSTFYSAKWQVAAVADGTTRPFVFYTNVDAQCDKLAMVVCRTKLTTLAMVDEPQRFFSKARSWNKV